MIQMKYFIVRNKCSFKETKKKDVWFAREMFFMNVNYSLNWQFSSRVKNFYDKANM